MNNERDASALKDPIIEEDPKAESSGPDYDNRESDQYIRHAGDEEKGNTRDYTNNNNGNKHSSFLTVTDNQVNSLDISSIYKPFSCFLYSLPYSEIQIKRGKTQNDTRRNAKLWNED